MSGGLKLRLARRGVIARVVGAANFFAHTANPLFAAYPFAVITLTNVAPVFALGKFGR
jgi:hypothetical protein